MIDTIYVEREIQDTKECKKILARHARARIHILESYTEIFNQKKQNFRLQKNNPKLILAKKRGRRVHSVPKLFNLHRPNNYYFSHLLNCPFDCQYCYLQAQFSSAHYVHFVNSQDFFQDIQNAIQKHPEKSTTIFTGYDCDSLALDTITNFYETYFPLFQQEESTEFEIRTKSQNIAPLLNNKPLNNVIVAFSLNPQEVVENIEKKTASLENRLLALQKLSSIGYSIAIRLDPIIDYKGAFEAYNMLIDQVFKRLKNLHSVTLGPYRLAKNAHAIMRKKQPNSGLVMCDQQPEILDFVKQKLLNRMDAKNLFLCY